MSETADNSTPIAVLGAGSWGSALALHLARLNHPVRLWCRRPDQAQSIQTERKNPYYLEDVEFPENLTATSHFEKAVEGVEMVVVSVPSHTVRQVTQDNRLHWPRQAVVVSATKGLEQKSHLRMSQVIQQTLGTSLGAVACVSGPCFASGLAGGDPSAMAVAGQEGYSTSRVLKMMSGNNLRLYANQDLPGLEFGGSLKNVIAIATGVVAGLGLGHNSAVALLTRGLNEISQLAQALGAQPETFQGLGGLGDLVLTCTGSESRNRTLGFLLGQGKSLDEALEQLGHVAEGVRTTQACLELAEEAKVEMPIAEQMAAMLFDQKSARDVVTDLLSRRLKYE